MPPKPFAFVIMPFDSKFDDVYKLGIKPALTEAGYFCERLDEQIFEETMLDRIYNQISKADLIVADLSDRNANVFYETGYAHALGKRVLLATKLANDIPFDLKHHFHVVYGDSITSLKERIGERAVWFLDHPDNQTLDPFSMVEIWANGTQVTDLGDEPPVVIAKKLIMYDGDREPPRKRITQWVDLSFNLHPSPSFSRGYFNYALSLVCPREITKAGHHIDDNSSIIYDRVQMPDGQNMFKCHRSCHVSPGEPSSTGFHLTGPKVADRGGYNLTLRLHAEDLHRDFPIALNVLSEGIQFGKEESL